MENALEEVAVAADAVADEQRQIARDARSLQERRDQGWTWARLFEADEAAGLVHLLRRSARRLAGVTADFTHAIARGLSSEGESRRQIARRLGVSHQRVTAMLNHRRHSGETAG